MSVTTGETHLKIIDFIPPSEDIKKQEKTQNIKRVFSTNVFIPMNPNLSNKSYMYFTGFVKLVETFKDRTNFDIAAPEKKWYLYVYYDRMFDDFVDKEINLVEIYKPKDNNNSINTDIKKSFKDNYIELSKLFKLYNLYLEHIKNNTIEYNFIKLISFNDPYIGKKNKHYLGHPDTFGSVIRLEPLYHENLDFVFCINISHAITPNLMNLINLWVKSEKLFPYLYDMYDFEHLGTDFLTKYNAEYGKYNITKRSIRFALCFFGISLRTKFQNKEFYTYLLNKNYDYKHYLVNKKYGDFGYGVDEFILSQILYTLFRSLKSVNSIKDETYIKSSDILPLMQKKIYIRVNDYIFPLEQSSKVPERDIKRFSELSEMSKLFAMISNDLKNRSSDPEISSSNDAKFNYLVFNEEFFELVIFHHRHLGRKLMREGFGKNIVNLDGMPIFPYNDFEEDPVKEEFAGGIINVSRLKIKEEDKGMFKEEYKFSLKKQRDYEEIFITDFLQ